MTDKIFDFSESITRENAIQAFLFIRDSAQKNGTQGMSIEEINHEIYKKSENINKRP